MRLLIAFLTVLCTASVSHSESRGRHTLTLQIEGLRNDTGIVGVLLFQSSDGFPDSRAKAFRSGGSHPSGRRAIVSFEDLPAGEYAVAVLHDENENYRMDWKMLVVPAEGVGFSKNPAIKTAAPAFEQTSIHVPLQLDTDRVIRLQYL